MSHDRIILLQEEIGRAGRTTAGTRKSIVGAGALLLILLLMPWSDLSHWPELWLVSVTLGGCLGVAVSAPVAYGVAAVLQGRRRERIQQGLAALTPRERAQVLEPLWREPTDAGKIADQLRRDFRPGSELSPSRAPAGRGDEVAECETERGAPLREEQTFRRGVVGTEAVARTDDIRVLDGVDRHCRAANSSGRPCSGSERRGIGRSHILALLAVACLAGLSVSLPQLVHAGHRELDAELNQAANEGDSRQIALLLAAGARVNAANPDGETPLMKAAYWGFGAAVNTLLSHGADVNRKSGEGKTALSEAVAGLYRDIFPSSYDANRGAKPFDSNRLTIASLLAHGADANARCGDGWTLLSTVSASGDVELARLLLAKGAHVNARNADGTTALRCARNGQRRQGWPRFGPSKFVETERLLLRSGGVE